MRPKLKNIPIKLIYNEFDDRFYDHVHSEFIGNNEIYPSYPILLEGPENGIYFLIDGLRRLEAHKYNKFRKIQCLVKSATSQQERLMLRLQIEMATKHRTGFERERLIVKMLEDGLTTKEIASKVVRPNSWVEKCIKSRDIDEDTKREAEQERVSREALVILKKLPIPLSLNDELHNLLVKEKTIGLAEMQAIKKITAVELFASLSFNKQRQCCCEAIKEAKFTKEKAQNIVRQIYTKENSTTNSHYDWRTSFTDQPGPH